MPLVLKGASAGGRFKSAAAETGDEVALPDAVEWAGGM
jgi:hypothetical protein